MGQSSQPEGPAPLQSHDIKPHSNRCHHKAEGKDPSEERRLGEKVRLGLPSGSLRESSI